MSHRCKTNISKIICNQKTPKISAILRKKKLKVSHDLISKQHGTGIRTDLEIME